MALDAARLLPLDERHLAAACRRSGCCTIVQRLLIVVVQCKGAEIAPKTTSFVTARLASG